MGVGEKTFRNNEREVEGGGGVRGSAVREDGGIKMDKHGEEETGGRGFRIQDVASVKSGCFLSRPRDKNR